MMDGMFLNSTKMNTAIKGQQGYNQSFADQYRDEIQQKKAFLWIYKG